MTSRSNFGKMNSTLGSVVPLAMFSIGFSRVFVFRSKTDIGPNDCYWQPYGWPIVKKSVGITFKEMSIGSKEKCDRDDDEGVANRDLKVNFTKPLGQVTWT